MRIDLYVSSLLAVTLTCGASGAAEIPTVGLVSLTPLPGVEAAHEHKVMTAIEDLVYEQPGARVVSAKRMSRMLQEDVIAELALCTGDIGCMADLGFTAEVTRLLFYRVTERPAGTIVAIVLLDTDEERVMRRAWAIVPSPAQLPSALRDMLVPMLGASAPFADPLSNTSEPSVAYHVAILPPETLPPSDSD